MRIRKGSIEATLSDETSSLVGDTQDQTLPDYDSFKSIERVSGDEESAEQSVEGHNIHRYDTTVHTQYSYEKNMTPLLCNSLYTHLLLFITVSLVCLHPCKYKNPCRLSSIGLRLYTPCI